MPIGVVLSGKRLAISIQWPPLGETARGGGGFGETTRQGGVNHGDESLTGTVDECKMVILTIKVGESASLDVQAFKQSQQVLR